MRRALAALILIAGIGQATAVDGAVPWQKYPRLASPTTRLEIADGTGKPIKAGTTRAWLMGHAEMNDCSVSDGFSQNVQITCVRRGLYNDGPGKKIKLVFTYTGKFVDPKTLLVLTGTTKGNPLIGDDLVAHFSDELEN